MTHSPVYPPASAQIAEWRKQLAPGIHEAFQVFSRQVFADGALDEKTKQLIAVAVAHVTQCPYCIQGHTKAALRKGAGEQELMEAIWVAAEMRAGGAYAHSTLALETAGHVHGRELPDSAVTRRAQPGRSRVSSPSIAHPRAQQRLAEVINRRLRRSGRSR